jgi:hypothetical protein
MERVEILKIIKDNWDEFKDDFDGHSLVSPNFIKNKYGFTDEFLKPYINDIQSGGGKYQIYNHSGDPVQEVKQTVYCLHFLDGLGRLLGNPDWYHFQRANECFGRGREARNWMRVIGIAIGVYKASDEVEA